MPTARRIIKKLRHIPKKVRQKAEPKWKKYAAKRKSDQRHKAAWERDKKIVRDKNFKKMLQGYQRYRKEKNEQSTG